MGNRTLKTADGSLTTSTYDAANQLHTAVDATGTRTFTFDASGNQQIVDELSGRTTNTWDFENQNTLVVLPSGSRVTMTYTADFLRYSKES